MQKHSIGRFRTRKMTSNKDRLFVELLPKLKEAHSYFRFSAIQTAVNDAELEITDGSLKQYINEAVHRGIIHDATEKGGHFVMF